MAPFAPNNTGSIFVHYSATGSQTYPHVLQLRVLETTTAAQAKTTAIAICTALANCMYSGDSFSSAEFRAKGTDFTVPVTWTPIVGQRDINTVETDPESLMYSWYARDTLSKGHYVLEFFSTALLTARPSNNRYDQGTDDNLDGVTATLIDRATAVTASDRICCVSQGQPIFKSYINVRNQAYWQTKQRS